ncbi:MAG: twin-arginine translocase subunit TatC [bacterium]
MNKDLTFLDHLGELRKRILNSLIAVFIASIICYLFKKEIFVFLKNPLGKDFTLYYFTPYEGVFVYLKVVFFASIFLAFPFVLYQIWMFILPALKLKERKIAIQGFFVSMFLFFIGVFLAYFYLLPFGIKFLLNFSNDMTPLLSASKYFSFILIFLLTFGIIFQMPLIMLFLTKVGIVKIEFLKKKRKEVILGCAIVSAVITPSADVINMLIVMIPLVILYEIGIICSIVANFKRK